MTHDAARRGLRICLVLALAGAVAACGDGPSPTVPIDNPGEGPLADTGRVIVANSFVVEATDSAAGFDRYSSGATLPTDLGPTAGKTLVLSLRDALRPDIVCSGGTLDSNCAVLEVLEDPSEGFVGVALPSGRQRYFLQSTFRLDVVLEPA
ncbi:MAG: hypothetical protein HKN73_12630 [Gemmatimonadetes bacterium]|nr:hypothetical protein [Gemmatimonadota bacterium]